MTGGILTVLMVVLYALGKISLHGMLIGVGIDMFPFFIMICVAIGCSFSNNGGK